MTTPLINRVTQDLINRGKLIEAGWVGLLMVAISMDASEAQVEALRDAFFCGAQHMYTCMMSVTLDPVTEADAQRLALIDNELQEFLRVYQIQHPR